MAATLAQLSSTAAPAAASGTSALRKQAQVLVATTFFGTLLKQMRESPFRSELFDGGRGGQAFGSLYDQQMAERMARGTGEKLVTAIVRKLDAKRAYDGARKTTGISPARRAHAADRRG